MSFADPRDAAAQGAHKLEVVSLGSSAVLPVTLYDDDCCASLALRVLGDPVLLIGVGAGVLRRCQSLFGRVPAAVFLPSAKMHHIADLQGTIEAVASNGGRLLVYGAADVLDQAIATIDDDIVADVRDSVEFLQVELGAPTAFHHLYYLLTQRCESKAAQYNVCVLDVYQRPVLAMIDGPMPYVTVFQQCPTVVVRRHKGLDIGRLYDALGGPRLLLTGHKTSPTLSADRPGASLRGGDSFVAPTAKGAWGADALQDIQRAALNHPKSATGASRKLAAADDDRNELTWIENDNRPRLAVAPASPRVGRATTPTQRTRTPPQTSSLRTAMTVTPSQHQSIPDLNASRTFSIRDPVAPPRKLYVYNNEDRDAEPLIVMLSSNMNLQTLKNKIASLTSIRPFGQLYTVDNGLVRSTDDLQHGQDVIATKHAGAPFDVRRLPRHVRFTRPAASDSDSFPLA